MTDHMDNQDRDQTTSGTDGDWAEHIDSPMPGCTAGSEAPVTAITTSMMTAYAAMRNGVTPNRAGGDGTLIEAMLEFSSGENTHILTEVMEAMAEGEGSEESLRASVFVMPRQRSIQHLVYPPRSFESIYDERHGNGSAPSPSKQRPTTPTIPSSTLPIISASTPPTTQHTTSPPPPCFLSLFDTGYISDDEGPRSLSRISPCTFRHWARGAATHRRLPIPDLTAHYRVPYLPSAVWTPTGADPSRLPLAKQAAFDRMDPVAGLALRKARYGPLQVPAAEPGSEGEGFSAEEVAAALAGYEGPQYGDVPGWEAEGWVLEGLGELERLREEEGMLEGENEGLRAEVERLRG
ncbi:hypothetical protein B0T18DRAFT_471398 [Schizothecium vesticola]|uniref:Uncharacterized protein n=1 Tax=Schizothecium vesticola TaxID=314040 RepID=A0AA40EJL3_9PEZI|nr:hypothetical protein B0T18DRAFT_471398 [Schizothecium vesticola]